MKRVILIALVLGLVAGFAFSTPTPSEYRYSVSRCVIPPDFFNEGRYIIGINASSYRIKRYFQDEYALTFTVDAAGAPGTHWPETRFGMIRPRLDWKIERDNNPEIQYVQVGSDMMERHTPGESQV